ncbi:MAG: hypothetical protein OTI37_04740 [Planctomycetota bacterium]|nr:hypothetical protein [Planctomycetota bacterium]
MESLMDEDLKNLLIIISIAAPIGLVLGLILRLKFPESCKKLTKYSLNARWKLFTFGVVLFAALAVASFMTGNVYQGWLCVGFTCLELWCLITAGFKPLSKEMENKIDQSDPTKLSPFRFWK